MDSQLPDESPATPHKPEQADSNLELRLEVASGARLHVTVETHAPDGSPLEQRELIFTNPPQQGSEPVGASIPPRAPRVQRFSGLKARSLRWLSANTVAVVFALALGVYLITRLIGLVDFPIYFFTDEAIQTVRAADLVRDNFTGYDGEILPTYFQNGGQYNLGVSVYLQTLPYIFFGKSVFATRAVPAILSIIAAISIALILKHGFQVKHTWIGVLVLAVTPVWFLHSRTAFETVLAASFYAAFLYAYIRYRQSAKGWIYAVVGLAALTFYTYSPAQMVIVVTIVLLFFSDIKYHWQNRKYVLRGLGLGLLMVVPYLRFQMNHPGETLHHLTILNSYWIQTIPFSQKIATFFKAYLQGINPFYWYTPESEGLVRHIMKGYGYLWRVTLPFSALGFIAALIKIKNSAYRSILAALIAAPTGMALVGLGVTRLLFVVIPVVVLSSIGYAVAVEALVKLVNRRWPRVAVRPVILALTFALIAAATFTMMNDALVNGPTWFSDYGLGGMQWGGRQIFAAVDDYIKQNPSAKVILSPSWSNGTDMVARFFAGDIRPFQMGSIDGWIEDYKEINPDTVFVMIPEEYKRVQESGKFTDFKIDRTVDYPDGSPGFRFVRLRYVDNIQDIFQAERDARRALTEETVALQDGSQARVAFPSLDMGQLIDIFDNNPGTLIRTREANPLKLVVTFANPRPLQSLTALVGGTPSRLTVVLMVNGESQPVSFSLDAGQAPNPRDMTIQFGKTYDVVQATVEVLSVNDSEPAHVHLWELSFK